MTRPGDPPCLWFVCFFLSLFVMPHLPAGAETLPSTVPDVAAGRIEGSIRLDGRLDEPAWQAAGTISDLVQQDPRPGEPTVYRTEVRVLAGGDTLFIGVECSDPFPDQIAVHTLQRDGSMGGDDSVAFVLDTYGDRRTGYLFRVNAAAARLDGLISGPDSFSEDWDGIWDARTHRTPNGWTLEVAVPARSLRFTRGLDRWGFNLERHVARDRMVLKWAGTTLDSSLEDLSRAGTISGIGGLEQGLGISISPYGLGRYESVPAEEKSTYKGTGGLDVTYDFTPDLAGVLTVNPDFAETDVDTRQINLTRFPLFFPEKRAFFLEGSSLFEFATGLGRNFIPFYSRLIGLRRGKTVRIDLGAKVVGRAGPFGISALGTHMESTELTEKTDLFAGRITCDAGEHLRLGTIATLGDPVGVEDNRLLGVDALWHTSTFRGDRNLTASAWAARTAGDLPDPCDTTTHVCTAGAHVGRACTTQDDCGEGDRNGFGVDVNYPNDRWSLYARAMQFGDALEPALGFLPRPATRRYQAGGAFQPRHSGPASGWARQFFFQLSGSRVDDLEGNTESWSLFAAPFSVITESGEHFEIDWQRQFDRPDSRFEIASGVLIPAGPHYFDRYGLTVEAASYRPWQVGGSVWWGEFYGGRLTQFSPYAGWNSRSGRFQLKFKGEGDYGHLPAFTLDADGDGTLEAYGGDFVERLYQLQAVLAFTPDLVFSSYLQYDTASSRGRIAGLPLDGSGPSILPRTVSHTFDMNNRVRYTIRPGKDFYLVWNRRWSSRPEERSQQVVVKLRWTFRG